MQSAINVQIVINTLSQRATDAVNLRQIINTCCSHSLQSAELPQELAPPLWPKARNLLQARYVSCLRPALPMAGNGKSMRLIA